MIWEDLVVFLVVIKYFPLNVLYVKSIGVMNMFRNLLTFYLRKVLKVKKGLFIVKVVKVMFVGLVSL
jgi:hypothetical protein